MVVLPVMAVILVSMVLHLDHALLALAVTSKMQKEKLHVDHVAWVLLMAKVILLVKNVNRENMVIIDFWKIIGYRSNTCRSVTDNERYIQA